MRTRTTAGDWWTTTEIGLPQCEDRNQCHGLRLLDGSIAHPRSSAHGGLLQGRTLQSLAYHDRLIFVEDGKQVVPGITAHAATGHSPGHYIYTIESRDETLIIIGDLSHHEVLLLKRSRWEFAFDHDPAKAVKTRIRVFDQIAQERRAILACHFPFPGLGHLRKDADGYTWVTTPMDLGSKTAS